MTTVLYIIWILIPTAYLLLWLWAKLEEIGKKSKRSDAPDLFNQFLFIVPCVVATFLLDAFCLPFVEATILPTAIPLAVVRIFLLPAVLYLASVVFGGSKPIRIAKAPRPTENRQVKR